MTIPAMKRFTGRGRIGLLALAILGLGACTNPETPAGFEGYIHHVPLMFGKMAYRGVLRGPASTGVSWRLYTLNIDMRANSYAEHFKLLTLDNLNVSFEVNTRIKLRDGSVKEVVESWGAEHWYEWNVKEPLRTIVRRKVMEVSATDIQLKTEMVRQQIFDNLMSKYAKTPIEILSVDIGQIEFPTEVTQAIERKIAKQQELQRQEFVLAKTTKEAAIRVLEALKVAKQQRIISSTLDPLYVQRKAVQVYRQLAESPNKTVIVLPNSPDGTGMPLVLTHGQRKNLSQADEKLLETMEHRYMKQATKVPEAEPATQEPSTIPATAPAAPEPAPPEPAPPEPTHVP